MSASAMARGSRLSNARVTRGGRILRLPQIATASIARICQCWKTRAPNSFI
jgi:hypothetical protein